MLKSVKQEPSEGGVQIKMERETSSTPEERTAIPEASLLEKILQKLEVSEQKFDQIEQRLQKIEFIARASEEGMRATCQMLNRTNQIIHCHTEKLQNSEINDLKNMEKIYGIFESQSERIQKSERILKQTFENSKEELKMVMDQNGRIWKKLEKIGESQQTDMEEIREQMEKMGKILKKKTADVVEIAPKRPSNSAIPAKPSTDPKKRETQPKKVHVPVPTVTTPKRVSLPPPPQPQITPKPKMAWLCHEDFEHESNELKRRARAYSERPRAAPQMAQPSKTNINVNRKVAAGSKTSNSDGQGTSQQQATTLKAIHQQKNKGVVKRAIVEPKNEKIVGKRCVAVKSVPPAQPEEGKKRNQRLLKRNAEKEEVVGPDARKKKK